MVIDNLGKGNLNYKPYSYISSFGVKCLHGVTTETIIFGDFSIGRRLKILLPKQTFSILK